IASKEVTIGEFADLMKKEHPKKKGQTADHPVTNVSFYEAAEFCNRLSKRDGIPEDQWCYLPKEGKYETAKNHLRLTGYRLPTLAEWEMACRAGTTTKWSCGDVDEELLQKYACCRRNSYEKGPFPVGTLKPNAFGLFDMHGNVTEWCYDPAAPLVARG